MEEFRPINSVNVTDTASVPPPELSPSVSHRNKLEDLVRQIKPKFVTFNRSLLEFFKKRRHQNSFNPDHLYSPTPRAKFNFTFKKGPAILIVAALFLIGVFLVFSLRGNKSSIVAQAPTPPDSRPVVKAAKATTTVNREFQFPITDDKGKEVTKLKFAIGLAELRDEIVFHGKIVPTIKGRTILVLNIKLTNDYNKPVQIKTKDYARLFVNDSSDPLAPKFDSDPVTVQPIATDETR